MKRTKTPTAFDEIDSMASLYKRHGGKKNRSEQVAKIRRVLSHAKNKYQTKSVHEMGARQIISFWKENRSLSDRTLYAYWLALRELYSWLNRTGTPPKPNYKGKDHDENS